MRTIAFLLAALAAVFTLPTQGKAATCNFGPYVVFFELNDARITAETAQILDEAVSGYFNCGGKDILLTGHTDSAGGSDYNLRLSDRRAAAVEAYLVSKGIPAANISREAFGEARLRVPSPDGVRDPRNRRVEISAFVKTEM